MRSSKSITNSCHKRPPSINKSDDILLGIVWFNRDVVVKLLSANKAIENAFKALYLK